MLKNEYDTKLMLIMIYNSYVDRMQRERDIVVYFYKFKEGKFDIK
jgi:hypothetical protein